MGGESEDDEGNPNVSATKHVTLPNGESLLNNIMVCEVQDL